MEGQENIMNQIIEAIETGEWKVDLESLEIDLLPELDYHESQRWNYSGQRGVSY